jgi:hypothetical protein
MNGKSDSKKGRVVVNKTYRVAIQGVREAFAKDKVVGELAMLFKKKPEEILPLLDAGGAVVKKGVDFATANKYREVLECRGCACSVEAEVAQGAGETPVSGDSPTARSVDDSAELKPRQSASSGQGMQLQPLEIKPDVTPTYETPTYENFASPALRNPYATPSAAVADSLSDDDTIRDVARYQRMVLMSILASFASNGLARVSPGILTGLLLLGIGIFSIWSIYRLSKALELSAALWVVVMFIPLFNLLGMLYVNQKATGFLKAQGLRVGLLGAKV